MEATRNLLPSIDLPFSLFSDGASSDQSRIPVRPREERFLKIGCKPLRSSCCGCPLQLTLKFFATFALVIGAIGTTGSLLSLGLPPLQLSLIPLLRYILMLFTGYLLWCTAARLDLKTERWAMWCILGLFLLEVATTVMTLITFNLPSTREDMVETIRKQYINGGDPVPSDENLQETVTFIIRIVLVSMTVFFAIKTAIFIAVFYIIWSYGELLKRGEYLLLTTGSSELPLPVTQMVAQQYLQTYPQAVVNYPDPPLPTVPPSDIARQAPVTAHHSSTDPQTTRPTDSLGV